MHKLGQINMYTYLSVCFVSVETSGKVFQINYKDLYNHNFYLSSNEQTVAEGVQATLQDNDWYLLHSRLQASASLRNGKGSSKCSIE